MNLLKENNVIKEIICGTNFAYVLQDNTNFLPTEYKVLQSQGDNFLKCMKMLYNGKIELFYVTSTFKSLKSLIFSIDPDSFMKIVSNLLSDVIEVKHNGFLHCQNIDLDFDKIFIDPTTLKVNLVYLPLNKSVFDDYSYFENELRTSLVKLISENANLDSPKTRNLSALLKNGTLTIDDILMRIKNGTTTIPDRPVPPEPIFKHVGMLSLIAMNIPERVELVVDKNEYVIGKKVGAVDGVISFNKMISRIHCKIVKNANQFMIVDLQSANGTYVNRVRLVPNHPQPLKNGDIIRLANSDFQIVIR